MNRFPTSPKPQPQIDDEHLALVSQAARDELVASFLGLMLALIFIGGSVLLLYGFLGPV